jgi:hypothetical protein
MPCAACGNPSRKLLFRDKKLGIPICSKKCEHDYLKNLSPRAAEHAVIVQYLDNKIVAFKKRNTIGWGFSGSGVFLLLLALLIRDVNIFIVGIILASLSALATRQFEDEMKKLTAQRKRLAI